MLLTHISKYSELFGLLVYKQVHKRVSHLPIDYIILIQICLQSGRHSAEHRFGADVP